MRIESDFCRISKSETEHTVKVLQVPGQFEKQQRHGGETGSHWECYRIKLVWYQEFKLEAMDNSLGLLRFTMSEASDA